MTARTKVLLAAISVSVILIGAASVYIACQQILSLPFRATNDRLHQHGAPITLDLFIPAKTHIHETMTIGEVIRIRFQKPRNGLDLFLRSISDSVPFRYRFLGALVLYLFWVVLFLTFFRIFTWMRYVKALSASFIAGALVYYFVPDVMDGRVDDAAFIAGSAVFAGAVIWLARRKRLKKPASRIDGMVS